MEVWEVASGQEIGAIKKLVIIMVFATAVKLEIITHLKVQR